MGLNHRADDYWLRIEWKGGLIIKVIWLFSGILERFGQNIGIGNMEIVSHLTLVLMNLGRNSHFFALVKQDLIMVCGKI